MASNISAIVNQINVKLAVLFPTRTKIPNPYSLENNNKNFLAYGYGLIVGAGNYLPNEYCSYVIDREISVVFTQEVFRTDSDGDVVDVTIKQLSECVNDVQALFFAYDELEIDNNIFKVDITSVGGVETIFESKIFSIKANFIFSIREDL